jgi:cation transport ATPase
MSIPNASSAADSVRAHDGEMDDPTQDAAELRRTMYIAALWFAAALLSGTITTAILMASGWRPYRLAAFPDAVWIAGTSVASLGTVLLAWAGCPITKKGLAEEDKRKSLAVRIGIAAFIGGTAMASIVELSSPARLT